MKRKNGIWIAIWAVLVVVTGFLAFGPGLGYGPWHGWGSADGWNDDSRPGGVFGRYGMGPGMMGGVEPGRGWNMPFGMMMGRNGSGMPGMGGMMGYGYALAPGQLSGLTPDQTQQLSQLQNEAEERNNRLAQQLWAAQDALNRLQMSGKRDWNAIRSASQTLMGLQRQQLDAGIDFQQKVDSLLTDSQRQDMVRSWRGYGWTGAQ